MFRMQTAAKIRTRPTAAETLIDTGRIAKILLRQGASMNDLCVYLRCDLAYVALASDFFSGNHGVVVRALVEEWSLARIVQEVTKQYPVTTSGSLPGAA